MGLLSSLGNYRARQVVDKVPGQPMTMPWRPTRLAGMMPPGGGTGPMPKRPAPTGPMPAPTPPMAPVAGLARPPMDPAAMFRSDFNRRARIQRF